MIESIEKVLVLEEILLQAEAIKYSLIRCDCFKVIS